MKHDMCRGHRRRVFGIAAFGGTKGSFECNGVRIVRGLVGDMSMPRTYGSKIEVSG